ncbi:hypothetical protein WHR41_08740 [Cladosporium halotolerans]|uniref:N-acetyltransferase domain-containing protein n=1 Tax=Cladosporium halotolerans TaxID=1052096 RepID=A0AB34KFE8_9PEZI
MLFQLFSTILYLLLAASLSQTHPSPHLDSTQQPLLQPHHLHNNNTLRPITRADIPALATIYIEAFAPSALWHYTFPHLDSRTKPALHACITAQLTQAWPTRNKTTTFANVITVPDHEADGADTAVALAVWNLREAPSEKEEASPLNAFSPSALLDSCNPWPGANATRQVSLAGQFSEIDEKYFQHAYERQFYLALLATHPSWDGNGFGAAHCEWGMGVAKARNLPVTLLATQVGWPLYDSLGFEGLANVSLRFDEEGWEEPWFEVMEWHA